MRMTRTIPLTLVITALAAGAAGAAGADQKTPSKGVYSAEQILDADVYTRGGKRDIGDVDDLIISGDMSIRSFVVETENNYGLAGKSYVVPVDKAKVQMRRGDDNKAEYRVVIDMSADQLSHKQVYSDSWWNKTQKQANTAWQNTKKAADSTWKTVKQGTASALHSAKNAAHKAAEKASDATN